MPNSLIPKEIPLDITDVESMRVLFCLYISLLQDTYSPDIIAMSLHSAHKTCVRAGMDEQFVVDRITAVAKWWSANRKFKGMF